jgi:hypothetical protein
MLLPADWAWAAKETDAHERTRMSDNPSETHLGNFSHSEKAELRPELAVFNMGPLENSGYAAWMPMAVLLLARSLP